MKKLSMLICLLLFFTGIKAQDIKLPTTNDIKKAEQTVQTEAAKVTNQANIGQLIGQLTSGISDGAFTDAFKKNKGSFLGKANNIKDAAGASSAIQSLQGGLLPTAMDAGWSKVKTKWIKDAKMAKTVKSVAGVAEQLESNISDKFFKPDWLKARPAWQAALSAISK
ncbi:MAG: hypothetical protein WCI71_18430 [Bacteroidota bacterium]